MIEILTRHGFLNVLHVYFGVIISYCISFNECIAGAIFQKDAKKIFKFLSGVKNEDDGAPRQPFRVDKFIKSNAEITVPLSNTLLKVTIGTGMLEYC